MLLQSQPDGPVQDQVHEASHEDGGLDVKMQSAQNNTLLLMIAADRSECADCLSIDFLPQPITGKHGWVAQAVVHGTGSKGKRHSNALSSA